MGKLALSDAQEGMKVIRQIAQRMIQPDGNISSIIRLLNDPEQARYNTKPQIDTLRESTQKCFDRAQQTVKRFDDWRLTTMDLHTTILSRQSHVIKELERNPEHVSSPSRIVLLPTIRSELLLTQF